MTALCAAGVKNVPARRRRVTQAIVVRNRPCLLMQIKLMKPWWSQSEVNSDKTHPFLPLVLLSLEVIKGPIAVNLTPRKGARALRGIVPRS